VSDFNFNALPKDENWAALDAFTEELGDFTNIIPGYGEDINPYDHYLTIDDTEYPLAHGQLLPHLAGEVTPDVIFQLGQGNLDALENIEDDDTRTWAQNRMQQLGNSGAWGEDWGAESIDGDEIS
jgi:hypothetical protein